MAVIALPPRDPAQLPPLSIHRFTVDQYHRMVDVGILSGDDPVELLEGLVVIKGQSTLAPAISVVDTKNGNGRASPPLPVRRFTVAEYDRLLEAGIVDADEPLELLEGWIVRVMPHNPPHDAVISQLQNRVLTTRLPAGWFCRGQSALETDTSRPESDVGVVRGTEFDYLTRHPQPQDTAMLVEVSDTTLATDRAIKGPIYARASIPIYWIVNIPDRQIEVHTNPTGCVPEPHYRDRQDYRPGASVPLVIGGKVIATIPVDEILPP